MMQNGEFLKDKINNLWAIFFDDVFALLKKRQNRLTEFLHLWRDKEKKRVKRMKPRDGHILISVYCLLYLCVGVLFGYRKILFNIVAVKLTEMFVYFWYCCFILFVFLSITPQPGMVIFSCYSLVEIILEFSDQFENKFEFLLLSVWEGVAYFHKIFLHSFLFLQNFFLDSWQGFFNHLKQQRRDFGN